MNGSNSNDDKCVLYLHQIHVNTATATKYHVKLLVDNAVIETRRKSKAATWTPARILKVTSTARLNLIMTEDTQGPIHKRSNSQVGFSGEEVHEAFWSSEESVSRTSLLNNQSITIVLNIRPTSTSKATRAAIHKVQRAMNEHRPPMQSTGQRSEKEAKDGSILSKITPFSMAAFSILAAVLELLREQQKYDAKVVSLSNSLEYIIPFADRVLEGVSHSELERLETSVKRLYNLSMEAAELLCDHIQRNAGKTSKSSIFCQTQERIKALEDEFSGIKEELETALNFEASRTAECVHLNRLKPAKAGYDPESCCMPGTREAVLNQILDWALRPLEPTTPPHINNIFRLYGPSGVGKTTVVNSLCARLEASGNLGASFFCRHDDPTLRDARHIFPTLTHQLAQKWEPFRRLVVEELRSNSSLDPYAYGDKIFQSILRPMKKHPSRPFVVVVDALNECSSSETQEAVLKRLIDSVLRTSWFRLIITGRTRQDIHTFFEEFGDPKQCLSLDLAGHHDSVSDIQAFANEIITPVLENHKFPIPYTNTQFMHKITVKSNGLFIFIKALYLSMREEEYQEAVIGNILDQPSSDGVGALFNLYSNILQSTIVEEKERFRLFLGAVLVVAPYLPLRGETIAGLLGIDHRLVLAWMNSLGSLLYRDDHMDGAIRVNHISVLEFLTGSQCPEEFRVDIDQANMEVAGACLKTMTKELKFNICNLETSSLPNTDVVDLKSRVENNLSGALQYSCVYWSSHLCSCPSQMRMTISGVLGGWFEGSKPLFWIEALSLMGKVSVGVLALSQVLEISDSLQRNIIVDVLQFLVTFRPAIETSAPHVYLSALPFAPKRSLLRREAEGRLHGLIKVCEGQMELWPSARPSHRYTDFFTSVAYSPDGLHIATGSSSGVIQIWDAVTGNPIGEPLEGHTSSVHAVTYSPDGCYIASGSADKTIRIWEVETGNQVGKPLRGHAFSVYSVGFSPSGRHIASGSNDDTVRLWCTSRRKQFGEPLMGHTDSISSVAFSPKGKHVVSASKDGSLRVWDVEGGKMVGEPLVGHKFSVLSVACSPDGRHVASASSDNTIQIWNMRMRNPVGEPLKGHTAWVRSVAYSPDGRYLASGSDDGTLRIWDTETRSCIGVPLKGHAGWVRSVAFSPDGRRVISASTDNTIRFWDVSDIEKIGSVTLPHGVEPSSLSISGIAVNLQPDQDGWVRTRDGGLLFWVPEDYRNGLTSPATMTIPGTGDHRVVRLDLSEFRFGAAWTEIMRGSE
ncbi:hypothetical protein CPB86DRAFT_819279 [Serendipita vermifera]|nr:hypothetical protein CPB86DRAFT_819279 [Serendipita vermifera]